MLNVRNICILSIGMFLLNGCSSDEMVLSEELNETSEYVTGNSSYKIRLKTHAATMTTRAAIVGDESSATLDSLGIFALAREEQGTNEEAYSIQWFNDSRNWSFCLMDNVAAKMNNGGSISWKEEGTFYFYPITQFYNYDFYGYYPYTEDLTRDDNSITAHYTIDGTQDIIWGRATSDEEYAYSAKYYRTYGANATDPTLELKHMLTRLTFTVEPGETTEGSGDYASAENMKVKSIEICDAYTNVDLLIADRGNLPETEWSNPDNDARLVLRNDVKDTLLLLDEAGDTLNPVQVPTHEWVVNVNNGKGLQVGESVMLYPAEEYIVRIVLTDENDVDHISEIPLTLSSNPGTKFSRGYSYNVRIIVHGPRAILVKSTLTPWDEVDGPDVEL